MLQDRLIQDLRRVSRELARELGTVGARHPTVPCTVTEGHILVELDLEGQLTIGDLAERLALDKSTTSRAVSSLESAGRVTDRPDPCDLRRKLFGLTTRGQNLVDQIHEQADSRVREALTLLAPGEAEAILRTNSRYARALRNARHARDYCVRENRPRDNEQLIELIRDTRDEHRAVIGSEARALERQEHDMYTLYSGRTRCFLVVEHGERIMGGCGIAPLPGGGEGVCELQRMYFRPEIRGLGLGYRVLMSCLEKAREFGFTACYAETMAGMERASRLYEKAGFRRLEKPLGNTGHTFTDAWFRIDL